MLKELVVLYKMRVKFLYLMQFFHHLYGVLIHGVYVKIFGDHILNQKEKNHY